MGIVPGVDDRLPVEDSALRENHEAVAGQDLSVEVRASALAEGLPFLVFGFEQFAEHGGGLLRFAEFQPTAEWCNRTMARQNDGATER
ncbi:hypothetical protein M3B11_07270 [Brevibacterium sp. p3-SID960]|uniref:hypothetical protein n=1 Tax=Brevibacterium sp. p3-SID960 TaxID=2916063 RepID=UPI0021A63EEB|nr:hypothetical protein [Brevibacterium sp. p3-SID960]MCT1690755.1 hypothetical protein [Brevibacterium sp. p3-SID960]